MSDIRILVVTNMFPTPDEPWFGSFVAEQVDDLRAFGVEVEVMSFDGRRRRREYGRAALRVRRCIRERDFDLVHAHYGLSGAVACGQRKRPIVTTFHGSDTGYIRWQRAVSWATARVTWPICVSRQGAELLHLDSPPIIPIGVDTTAFRPRDRVEARQVLGWDTDATYVLFPGARRNHRKNVEQFDAVISRARERSPEIRSVALEGFSRDQVPLVMAGVDSTLMTSFFEGSPVAVKESLSCGTPVVSVPVGDNVDVLADLLGCAVVARDVDALAEALLASIDHGHDGRFRERAEQYSRMAIAERVVAVYERVLAATS